MTNSYRIKSKNISKLNVTINNKPVCQKDTPYEKHEKNWIINKSLRPM